MHDETAVSQELMDALAAVQRDVSATMPEVQLRFVTAEPVDWDSERALWVGLDDGRYWNSGIPVPEDVGADASMAAVAEAAQDTLMEIFKPAWPTCPQHGRVLMLAASPARWCCADHEVPVGLIADL